MPLTPAPVLKRRRLLLAACCAALLLGTYLPPAFERFGILDDYSMLVYFLRGLPLRYELHMAAGRPVLAALNELGLGAATCIDDLRWLRLFTVLAAVGFALLVAAHLLRAGWTDLEAAAIAVILTTLPPFQVHLMWAVLSLAFLPCLLSGVAVGLVLRAGDACGRTRWWYPTAAFGCMLVAMLIYQPPAMFAWLFLAMALLRPDGGPPWREGLRLALTVALLMGIAMAGGFIAWKMGTALYPHLNLGGRAQLVTDLAAKAQYFGGRLMGAMCLHAVVDQFPRQVVPIAASVGVFTLAGLLCFLRGCTRERVLRLAMVLLLLPAAYLPSLVSAESNATYRAQGALTALVAFLSCCALRGMLRHRPAWTGPILAVTAVACCATAHHTTSAYLARPQAQEMHFLEQGLSGCDTSRPIWILGAHWDDTPAPGTPMDDFGMPSSCQFWALDPMVALLLRESRGAWQDADVRILTMSCYTARVERSLATSLPREEAFRRWRSGAILPTVISTLQAVEELDPVRSRWVAQGPAGRTLEWRARICEEQPGRVLAWRSDRTSPVEGSARLQFADAPTPGTSTIHLLLEYATPVSIFGMPYGSVPLPPQAQVIDMRRLRELKAGMGGRP